MFLLVLFALSMASVPLFGGQLNALASIRFRYAWAVVAGLLIQIVIISLIPQSNPPLLATAHVISYLLIGLFVFCNRSQPGLFFVGLGWGCNLLAIAANGGVMPAAPAAVASLGRSAGHGFENSRALTHPRLLFLGDIFAMPRSWPLHNIFSVGDILVVVGAFILVHSLCGSRLARYFQPRGDRGSLGAEIPAS